MERWIILCSHIKHMHTALNAYIREGLCVGLFNKNSITDNQRVRMDVDAEPSCLDYFTRANGTLVCGWAPTIKSTNRISSTIGHTVIDERKKWRTHSFTCTTKSATIEWKRDLIFLAAIMATILAVASQRIYCMPVFTLCAYLCL